MHKSGSFDTLDALIDAKIASRLAAIAAPPLAYYPRQSLGFDSNRRAMRFAQRHGIAITKIGVGVFLDRAAVDALAEKNRVTVVSLADTGD